MAEAQTGVILWNPESGDGEVGGDQQLLERFVAQRDEAAFAGLVHRHGRSVWGVCRRVLRQQQDAEDAFQAVFLILSRKAASIRKGEAVGSWLYGVAYRIAMRARHTAARRQERERKAKERIEAQSPWGEAACQELQRILDEEVVRLPEKLRGPFVLCCLEGMSKPEAAKELACKEGTVSSRLAAARKLLKSRLARRGITLSAALTASALAHTTAGAAAPLALLQTAPGDVLASEAGLRGTSVTPEAIALANGDTDRSTIARLVPLFALLAALIAAIGGTTFAAIGILRFTEATEEPIVLFEPETFVPPGVAMGTPVGEQVLTVAFSPDGQRLVTAGAWSSLPGQLKIWDIASGNEVAGKSRIPGVRSSAFSPDGKAFVTGDFSGAITLRDSVTGDAITTVKAHGAGVNGVAFSADGMLLASAGLDRNVKLWSAPGLQELKTFTGHADSVLAVAFFRHGKAIVTGSQDRTAKIWDLDSGKEKFTLEGHDSGVEGVAISPDDKIVATASPDQSVRLWDARTGKAITVLKVNKGPAFLAVAFSPDGTFLAAAGRDGTVRLWDAKTLRPAGTLEKHDGAVWALAFSREGVLASGSADRTAKLWHLGNGKQPRTLNTSWSASRPVLAAAYSPNGKFVAVATTDKTVHIREAKSGDIVTVLAGHSAQVNSLAFSPDGKTLASGSEDETIKLWDWVAGNEKRTLKGHAGGVRALAFAPDGAQLASAGDDKGIHIWDSADGKELANLPGHDGVIRALAFAPNGQILASGGADMKIKLWDVAKGAEADSLLGHDAAVRALAFSSAGLLASAGDDNMVKLWKPSKGTEWLTLTGHTREVLALAFSPQGQTLVSAGQDGTVRVWDPARGHLRGILKGHRDAVTCLALHPHGHNLVSGSLDTMLLRWQPGKLPPTPVVAPAPVLPPVEKDAAPKKIAEAKMPPMLVLLTALQDVKGKEDAAPRKPAVNPNKEQEPKKTDAVPKGGERTKKKYAQEYYQALKGVPANDAGLLLFGPGADRCVKSDPAGLRITLPAGNQPGPQTGLATGLTLKGDFELTVNFEILQEPGKAEGGPAGTRVSVMAGWEQRGSNCVKITRGSRPPEGSMFVTYARIRGAKDRVDSPSFPDDVKTGRMRIVRAGTVLSFYIGEVADDSFELMHQTSFVADDLDNVRIVGATGSLAASLDVRMTDLRIRADGLVKGPTSAPPLPPAPVFVPPPVAPPAPFIMQPNGQANNVAKMMQMEQQRQAAAAMERARRQAEQQALILDGQVRQVPAPQPVSPPSRPRIWLVAAIIVGMLLMLGFAVSFGLWFFVGQRRRPAEEAGDDPDEAVEAIPIELPKTVAFTCAECGKTLKAKTALAGKKIKCPKCGKAVLVPESQDDEEDLPVV